jgi:hypothetical protein
MVSELRLGIRKDVRRGASDITGPLPFRLEWSSHRFSSFDYLR